MSKRMEEKEEERDGTRRDTYILYIFFPAEIKKS